MNDPGDDSVGCLRPEGADDTLGGKSDVDADVPSDVMWTTDDDAKSGEDEDEEGEGLAALDEEVDNDDEGGMAEDEDVGEDDEPQASAGSPEVNESAEGNDSTPVVESVDPTADSLPTNTLSDHEGGNADDERPRSKSSKRRRGKDKSLEKKAEGEEKPSSEKLSRMRDKSSVKKDGSPPRDGLFKRERDMLALNMKKLRAIARKAPVQVRIWTEPRKVKTPMDKYACAVAEAVCSDIFWAAIKNDLTRLRHLVQVEGVSVHTTMDPWMFHQTPLHWAAKGGAVQAIDYLVECGADVHKRDDNGSIPLHLACWAGHTQAAMALLRAGDLKDLLIADYDANLNALEWAGVRQHTDCIAALNKFSDSVWLPVFVADLIWKIISKTKMRTAEEKQREAQVALERAELKRLQQMAEQAKQAAQIGQAVVLDGSDAAKISFSTADVKPL